MADDVLLDTNVILRLLQADEPAQHKRAKRLFEEAAEGSVRLIVPSLVVAELGWVLGGFYKMDRSYVAAALKALCHTPNVVVIEAGVILRALEIFVSHKVDFVDAYLVALAEEARIKRLATFDRKHFRRFLHLSLVP